MRTANSCRPTAGTLFAGTGCQNKKFLCPCPPPHPTFTLPPLLALTTLHQLRDAGVIAQKPCFPFPTLIFFDLALLGPPLPCPAPHHPTLPQSHPGPASHLLGDVDAAPHILALHPPLVGVDHLGSAAQGGAGQGKGGWRREATAAEEGRDLHGYSWPRVPDWLLRPQATGRTPGTSTTPAVLCDCARGKQTMPAWPASKPKPGSTHARACCPCSSGAASAGAHLPGALNVHQLRTSRHRGGQQGHWSVACQTVTQGGA